MASRTAGLGWVAVCAAAALGLVWTRRPEPGESSLTRPTVESRLAQYGEAARERLGPFFGKAGVPYPPARVVLVGLKRERLLEVHAAGPEGAVRFIRRILSWHGYGRPATRHPQPAIRNPPVASRQPPAATRLPRTSSSLQRRRGSGASR